MLVAPQISSADLLTVYRFAKCRTRYRRRCQARFHINWSWTNKELFSSVTTCGGRKASTDFVGYNTPLLILIVLQCSTKFVVLSMC